jgi:hypothetical protein
MTAEEHNKTLGICHLAYGALMTLFMLAMFIFMWLVLRAVPPRPGGPDPDMPLAFIGIMFAFLLIYSLIFFVPSFIAGYAMLKRKSWARTASIVAGVMEVMSFPFGTAVGVYSFWFMFSETGKSLYDVNATRTDARPYALHDAPPQPASDWNAQTSSEREHEYPPPDWRNQ